MCGLVTSRALRASLLVAIGSVAAPAWALPIGFGVNQGSLTYSEIKNDHFYIYHDSRSPTEGTIALESLDHARPYLERWFGVERETGLPVIVSDVTYNASFANLITDALEVQTGGAAPRDLFLHEYVHSTMYRHFERLIGPAQSVLHIAWMPEWFIEGLAETLSVSVGSDVQAGVERYQALSGDWPSYDRLHSLYGSQNFFPRGYATSGGLVAYILRQGNVDRLQYVLREFYDYTMPWYWFWAAVPFNGFMPMDRVLEHYAKFDGRSLYERYKKDAATFWKAKSPAPLWSKQPGVKRIFDSFYSFRSVGPDLRYFVRMDGKLEEHVVVNGKSGWAEKSKKVAQVPAGFNSAIGFFNKTLQAAAENERDAQGFDIPNLKVRQVEGAVAHVYQVRPSGLINHIWDTPDALLWWEQNFSKTSICFLLKQELKSPKRRPNCSFTLEQPKALEYLGAKLITLPNKDVQAKEIWFNVVEQTLVGDRSQVIVFDAVERRIRTIETGGIGRPIAAAFAGSGVWMLAAERGVRTIRKIEGDGRCIGMYTPSDHILGMWGHSDGGLSIAMFAGQANFVTRMPADSLKLSPCTTPTFHTSPLTVAMASGGAPMTLKAAMSKASYWQTEKDKPIKGASASVQAAAVSSPVSEEESKSEMKKLQDAAPLGESIKDTDATSGPAKWRGRQVIAGVPWIGGEDARGYQVGIISVPLMDHMQNDTVRATFLFGLGSNLYPSSEISYLNTHFWPTLKFDVFRAQTFNGTYYNSKGEQLVNYFDEKGVRASSVWAWLNNGTSFELGVKASNLKPYLGRTDVTQGNIREFHAGIGVDKRIGLSTIWSNRLFANDVPEAMNEAFDYNQVGFSTGLSRSISLLNSNVSVGLEGSRTRGKKTKVLQEYYQPLKTFVPGTGGGSNKQSGAIAGTGALFSSIYGDTQGRASANWVIPIIPDVDKLVWIFYLDRLDLTAFFNFGGAWSQRAYPYRSELLPAHGYNLDLQFNVKNIHFNIGTGAGQVFGDNVQVYWTFGFDAVF